RKRIMGIRMDSRTPDEPKPDAGENLAVQLLKLVAPGPVAADYEDRLRAGGLGYGDLKKKLFECYWEHFAGARQRRAELAADPAELTRILQAGAARARAVARPVLERVRRACGLD
ncbi:MAG: tryptophan--tRNA ligase, partial [Verrucomicrobiae bacterium]|nr:tryptophan--tRNA ligase [Verrucomicrobiae bacterium]